MRYLFLLLFVCISNIATANQTITFLYTPEYLVQAKNATLVDNEYWKPTTIGVPADIIYHFSVNNETLHAVSNMHITTDRFDPTAIATTYGNGLILTSLTVSQPFRPTTKDVSYINYEFDMRTILYSNVDTNNSKFYINSAFLSVTVPEPSSFLLVCLGMLFIPSSIRYR